MRGVMLITDKDLEHLELIKDCVASTFKSIDGVDYVFWQPLWNINDVGYRWRIKVRTLATINARSACYDGESKLHRIYPEVGWSFDLSQSDYSSYENMNWNMNSAGFVILD